jgi:hypothetical protein
MLLMMTNIPYRLHSSTSTASLSTSFPLRPLLGAFLKPPALQAVPDWTQPDILIIHKILFVTTMAFKKE